MPHPTTRWQEFEGRAARLIHQKLPMTPHEFAHEEVWSYLTCCWLLDVAVWRFGHDADRRRFIGDVNRNTFRRMWWRTDVLGPDIDLTQLGEDELVNITERPTIAADRRLARIVAREFLARVDRGEAESRMQLMREAMKRLLRLTPFITFAALSNEEVQNIIADVFDAAAEGIAGGEIAEAGRHRRESTVDTFVTSVPDTSPNVVKIPKLTVGNAPDVAWPPSTAPQLADDFETVAQVALDIAQRAGRVTNEGLRAIVPVSADEARQVFRALMERGELVRRGVKLGTHYLIPDPEEPQDVSSSGASGSLSLPDAQQRDDRAPRPQKSDRTSDSALRRLLRKDR